MHQRALLSVYSHRHLEGLEVDSRSSLGERRLSPTAVFETPTKFKHCTP